MCFIKDAVTTITTLRRLADELDSMRQIIDAGGMNEAISMIESQDFSDCFLLATNSLLGCSFTEQRSFDDAQFEVAVSVDVDALINSLIED